MRQSTLLSAVTRLFLWLFFAALILVPAMKPGVSESVSAVPSAVPAVSASAASASAVHTVQLASEAEESSLSKGKQVVAEAREHIGKPYKWGATGPKSFDCSGFVGYVYKQVGKPLPRTSKAQASYGLKHGDKITDRSALQPGDLIYTPGKKTNHIVIYAGGGKVIEAPGKGKTVRERPMGKKFSYAIRLFKDGKKAAKSSSRQVALKTYSTPMANNANNADKIVKIPAGSSLGAVASANGVKDYMCAARASNIRNPHVVRAGQPVRITAECKASRPNRTTQAQPVVQSRPNTNNVSGDWARLAKCESGGRWHIATGNGFYGGLQFTRGTWLAYGGADYAPLAHQASPSEQIAVATKVRDARGGYGDWPACSRELGLPR